jgi:hypothetical protein
MGLLNTAMLSVIKWKQNATVKLKWEAEMEQQKIKLSLCMLLGCGGIAPLTFNLSIRWR